MDSSVRDLTVGKPSSLIIGFAVPVFLSSLFQQLYNTVDSLVVGRYLGTESLAAITCAGNYHFSYSYMVDKHGNFHCLLLQVRLDSRL